MDADPNLLFGVLAMQSGLITSGQFIEACMLWTARKGMPMAHLLLERGWIESSDVSHIQYLIDRRLEKHGGDPKVSLAALGNDIKRQLAQIDDEEIQQSLGHVPNAASVSTAVTFDVSLETTERYSLKSLHASGGGGRVWLAHDTQLDRDVAFKELRPEAAGDGALWARFQREARITGQLEHPGIVPVYDYGRQSTNQPFYTMRFVKGRTMTEAARQYHANRASGQANSLELIALLNAFATVCNTIAYAHSRGVIHRDLKGENVVLGDFGEVVVLDWGLAKLVSESDPADHAASVPPREMGRIELTIQGQTVGTPGYMAPEQAAGRPDLINRHTDIYGLGAMLYEILTGHAPFTGSDTNEVMRRVREEKPLPPREINPDAPESLEEICLRAIAKNPSNRFDRAADLAQGVQLWQDLQRRRAEQELDLFFNLSLDLFTVAGFDGYLKRVNPAWERTLGYSAAEMLARPYLDFVHPEDREATVAQAEGLAIPGRAILSFRNRYRCKDGSYRWLAWVAVPFPEDQLIYASARDVTEQRLSEEKLRESELRYRSVVASLDEGIVILDGDGAFVDSNASAERILGLSAAEILGRTNVDPRWVTVSEDGSPFPQQDYPVTVTLRTGRPCSNVVMGIYKPDGTLNWISINSQPLIRGDSRTVYGVLASFTDITELKRTKQQLHTLEQKRTASPST